MIPILFESGTTQFNTNGLGRLAECIRCVVTEERNGKYELEFDYPINGRLYPEIILGRIISATHDETGDEQPFIIYRRSIPDLRGVVTFYACHISYLLNTVAVKPFTAGSCMQALNGIKSNSVNANPFTFWTDKSTTATFKNERPRNARSMLGGEENSILDVFGGGEYKFDKFNISLYAARGRDSGVEIYYGKNLKDLNQDIDNSGTYNAVVPYWEDSEGNISMLPEVILSFAESGERVDAVPMDLSSDFENMPTAAQMRTLATSKYRSGNSWLPSENLKVDFVQLWQTKEYKDFAPLQRASLCDTVSVYYHQAGIEATKQKVVRVAYNVLLERYDEMELGELQSSLGQAIKQNVLQTVPTTSMMEEAIQYATEMIRGGLGGYVVMTPGEHGYPQEILIMDTPDVNTAVNVWRFNRGGLGHSSSGYDGPFSDIALTADGRINATMITTGILNANLIRAGVLQDVNGNVTWNLSTGVLNMTKGSINLGSGNFIVTDAGSITAKTGKIGPFTMSTNGFVYKNGNSSKIQMFSSEISSYRRYEYTDGSVYSRGITIEEGGIYFKSDRGKSSIDDPLTTGITMEANQAGSYRGIAMFYGGDINDSICALWPDSCTFYTRLRVVGNFEVSGTKSRKVDTDSYSDRLLYCYETPTPLFGDIGEAVLDEEGICYVDLDDIFTEAISEHVEYQVFLQKEGKGDCWIQEKTSRYFVIQGTPNLRVAWEIKAKQKDYESLRLEQSDTGLEEYAIYDDPDKEIISYINKQEELLYG